MDFMMNKLAELLERFSGKIPDVSIPWQRFHDGMDTITPYLSDMNVIFPVDTILTILVLWGLLRAVLLVIWFISFIRKMLPF